MSIFSLLAAAPFVAGLGLICGFALGRRLPRAEDFPTPEETERLRREAWERHWRANGVNAAWKNFIPDAPPAHTHNEH